MRLVVFFIILFTIFILIDVYLWWSLRKTLKIKWAKWLIPLSTLLFIASFYFAFRRAGLGEHNAIYSLNFLVGISFATLVAKLLMITIFFTEDVVRILTYLVERTFSKKPKEISGRRDFVRNISLTVASIPLAATLWGITKGKYHFLINRFELRFPDLPAAFDGFKIVQFSDFHAGSFDHPSEVARGLEMLQDEGGDLIVFTGDLVNNRAEEARPFVSMLKRLSAPHGKFSILGNHDYGDYMPWKSDDERDINLNLLKNYHEKSGFNLLCNTHQVIEKDGEKLILVGVENWGKPPFPQYGNFAQALTDVPEGSFNVLLSHDPDHWEHEVRHLKEKVHLTLSGHTHGAQFGVDIPGWKWSPVKYRYKRWLGLYKEENKYLYVNRGFGFLGFPGRVGMRPEISVFTLKVI